MRTKTTDYKDRRIPQWIRLYTHSFSLIHASTVEQAGKALKDSVTAIQTGELPDDNDPLTEALIDLILEGAEQSITEYAKKIAGGKEGAERRYSDRSPIPEARDTDRSPIPEARDTDRYIREEEQNKIEPEEEQNRSSATPSGIAPADYYTCNFLESVCEANNISLGLEDFIGFRDEMNKRNWMIGGEPIKNIAAVLRLYEQDPRKLGVI